MESSTPMGERSSESAKPRRAPTAAYVVIALAGLGFVIFGVANLTERLDDVGRPRYGWTLAFLGLVLVGSTAHILWKRNRGERSEFEDS